jgi:hypothetical protein
MVDGAQTAIPEMPRVRSTDPTIRGLIDKASKLSSTFRHLIETIGATDGIVYADPGRCGHGVRACLVLTVKVAGPNRLLRIVVDTRKTDCALIASIGHELRHTIEVLHDRSVRSDATLFHFYTREGRHTTPDPLGAWETEAAVQAGIDVLRELRKHAVAEARPC